MKDRNKLFTRLWDLPYGRTTPYHLYDACKNSREFVQKLQLERKIPVHNGCVNSICWNENGRYLLSGSDDQHLSVINGADYSVLAYIRTGHQANIFSAKFLPDSGDSHVVSSSGDGIIIYSDLERPESSMNNKFGCHRGTAYEIMTVPNDPNTFLSCGEDRTVRWFDIRTKTSCDAEDCKDDVLIFCRAPVTSIAVNPLIPYQLAVGSADSSVQIFDCRMLSTRATAGCLSNGFRALMSYFTVPDFTQNRRITSLCYSADGREMLVSYSSDYIYLFDVRDDMGKRPKVLSPEKESYSRTRPLMKRLRVRGDWSDTGPNSRPETEAGGSSPNNIIRRMTDILSGMLFSSIRNQSSSAASRSSTASSPAASSHSEDGDMDVGSDYNINNTERNSARTEENEINTSEAPENNENSSSSVQISDQPQNECELPSNNDCSAFEQKNPEPQPGDSLSIPSTSGVQTKSESTSVIKDASESSNMSELHEPSSPSPCASHEDAEEKNSLPETSSEPVETVNIVNSSRADEQNYMDGITIVNTHIIVTDSSSVTNYTEYALSPEASEANNTAPERSSESETEAAVQSIQRAENLPTISELQSPRSPSPELHNPEEVELMMEVDSWESDSDDASQPTSSVTRNRRRGHGSSCDENECDQKEVRKEKPPKSVKRPKVKKMYTGHRNARTMIKESTFWGDNFVMSGSDCGHIFIWDRHTTELVMIMEADHHVVNCLQPHPFDPILASSGIDYDIKLWAPLKEQPFFDVEKANEIVKRNEIMLEVTKDTITVPASFVFNMFNTYNTLNQLRNGHRQLYRRNRAARAANPDSNNR